MKATGLGDSIEKITKATGIKKIVDLIFDGDCGCEERKDKLNKIFPYTNVNCLTEEEYTFVSGFNFDTNVLSTENQIELLKVYNRVFNQHNKMTSCVSCWKEIIRKLKIVSDEYKK